MTKRILLHLAGNVRYFLINFSRAKIVSLSSNLRLQGKKKKRILRPLFLKADDRKNKDFSWSRDS